MPKACHKHPASTIRLNRVLYGLKQAGLVWYRTLAKSLKEIGLTPINSDAGIYVKVRPGRGRSGKCRRMRDNRRCSEPGPG
jgi:hypothetical protein